MGDRFFSADVLDASEKILVEVNWFEDRTVEGDSPVAG